MSSLAGIFQDEGEQIMPNPNYSGGDSDNNDNNPNAAGYNYKRHDRNPDGTLYTVPLEDQEDVISMWQEYDAERDLLEKLGLRQPKYKQKERKDMD